VGLLAAQPLALAPGLESLAQLGPLERPKLDQALLPPSYRRSYP
jgi:hypothetical protein